MIDSERFLAGLHRGVARTHTDVGMIYAEHGDTRKAEEHWRRAAVLDPKDIACREKLAALYERTRREPEALQVCEQLRRIVPRNAQYHFNVGVLYARMRRIEPALAAVRQAIELDPDNASFRRVYQQIQQRQ